MNPRREVACAYCGETGRLWTRRAMPMPGLSQRQQHVRNYRKTKAGEQCANCAALSDARQDRKRREAKERAA